MLDNDPRFCLIAGPSIGSCRKAESRRGGNRMSSSQPFLPSSPLSLTAGRRQKSRFTYKHLNLLSQSSTSNPLRVIAHIDLDAFYAQCEGVRLDIGESQPLAVQVKC